jgi:hypothetical protein
VGRGDRRKGITALALIAASALLIGGIAGPGATAFGDGGAATAGKKKKKKKKKCKPGFVKVKVKTKKGKGKKKRFKCVAQPGATPRPLVRATITWSGGGGSSDMDLWVFDANGNRGRAAANGIPSSTFSGNAAGPSGTETFTDLIFATPGARAFSFGVCQVDGGSHNLTVAIDYVTADGVHHLDSQVYNDNGAHHEYPGGAPIPPQFLTTCNLL